MLCIFPFICLYILFFSGSSSFGRATAFQAVGGRFEPGFPLNFFCYCSSGVEHFLGKEEVMSSNLINSSNYILKQFNFLFNLIFINYG